MSDDQIVATDVPLQYLLSTRLTSCFSVENLWSSIGATFDQLADGGPMRGQNRLRRIAHMGQVRLVEFLRLRGVERQKAVLVNLIVDCGGK